MRKKYKKWSYSELHAEALKYESRIEFQKKSRRAYDRCHSWGILDDVCSHMIPQFIKWSKKNLFSEALKYKSKTEFARGSSGAYKACKRLNILNEVCSHMKTKRTNWDYNMLKEKAKEFKTRKSFLKGAPGAYSKCQRLGIIEEICKHMQDNPYRNKPHCVYLIEIFTEEKELFFYVGQTSGFKKRLADHFSFNSSTSPVRSLLNDNDIKYKKHYIIKDNLTYKESIELEKRVVETFSYLRDNLLNHDLKVGGSSDGQLL